MNGADRLDASRREAVSVDFELLAPRRARLASAVVGVAVAAFFILMNGFAGVRWEPSSIRFEYGFPCQYGHVPADDDHFLEDWSAYPPLWAPLRRSAVNGGRDSAPIWRLLPLVANGGIAVCCVALIAALVYWRAQTRGFWRLTLKNGLLLVALISGFIAIYATGRRETLRQEAIVNELQHKYQVWMLHWSRPYQQLWHALGHSRTTIPGSRCIGLFFVPSDIGRRDGNAFLGEIADLSDVQFLGLGNFTVSPEALHRYPQLRSLRELVLARCELTDEHLAVIAECHQLRYLSLEMNPAITDAGLSHLESLHALQELYMKGTGVTPAGMDRIRQALPEL